VLRALERCGVNATFFLAAGARRGLARWVRTMLDAGHDVQLHCRRHVRHTLLSEAEIERDGGEALAILRECGAAPTLWRTPWGLTTAATERVARGLGLRLVRWDIDTHDWRGDPASAMLASCRRELALGGSVLMHDGLGPGSRRSGAMNTVELIAPLVRTARAEGLAVRPLAEALA